MTLLNVFMEEIGCPIPEALHIADDRQHVCVPNEAARRTNEVRSARRKLSTLEY